MSDEADDSGHSCIDSRSPTERVLERLAVYGLPDYYSGQFQSGLVAYVKDNNVLTATLVPFILPTDAEIARALQEVKAGSKRDLMSPTAKYLYRESLYWLQWLMFEDEPAEALETIAKMNMGQRGICGAIWGKGDLAFHCRTCEHDPTCAICVPCFQNGNHKDHDYSIIYTGGGCCDCGDETAWKREGFCSEHKGAKEIKPLPHDVAQAVGPVLSSLFDCWNETLTIAESNDHAIELRKVSNELTSAVVDMLLNFCTHSESLLSFVSRVVINTANLLYVLVRAERFLSSAVTKKLHELLLKLVGEPTFKYEFGKVFVEYYPVMVSKAIRSSSDDSLKNYPLLSTFCVQIFTVPTLTPRLVKEVHLLDMLLRCLGNIFEFCAGDDGRLEVNQYGKLHNTSTRVIEDIKFVLSHSDVAVYATHEQRDIIVAWVNVLSFVQGMNPQKRETTIHIEEENQYMHFPFILCHSIGDINYLLVVGAFTDSCAKDACQGTSVAIGQDGDNGVGQSLAKVEPLSREGSACTSGSESSSLKQSMLDNKFKYHENNHSEIPSSVLWLGSECLRALDLWLAEDNSSNESSLHASAYHGGPGNNSLALKKALTRLKNSHQAFGLYDGSLFRTKRSYSTMAKKGVTDGLDNTPSTANFSTESRRAQNHEPHPVVGMDLDDSHGHGDSLDCMREVPEYIPEYFQVFGLSDWPSMTYDVSSQKISFHMPLHSLLSFIVKEVLRKCFSDDARADTGCSSCPQNLSSAYQTFFRKLLRSCQPNGYSSYMMEHPLRLRVFCAQVHAGMWKKNGDAAYLSCEWYRSVRWSEHELELNLFSLQFCAALAPADCYIKQILDRFGLSSYISLDTEQSSEYEPVLVQDMLTLIIQIIKERRFCGQSATENLQRELVCKLVVGDATHSQLVTSLPADLSKSDQLQDILDRIAQYSTPSAMSQGKYALRLPYWKELDLYHPRGNPKDLQVAEERYLRFCGASALNIQLPKWTKIYQPLERIARIATCNMVLQTVRAVLAHHVLADKSAQPRAPDGVVVTALHLLFLGLDVCVVYGKSGSNLLREGDHIPLLAFAGEEIDVGVAGEQSLLSLLVLVMRLHREESVGSSLDAGNCNISSLTESLLIKFAELDPGCLSKLQHHAPEAIKSLFKSSADDESNALSSISGADQRKAKTRERKAAMLAKMRAEQSKFLASLESDADALEDVRVAKEEDSLETGIVSHEGKHDTCSLCHDPDSENPLSILVLLQKSRLVSFVDKGTPSWDQDWTSAFDMGKSAEPVNEVDSQGGAVHGNSSDGISSSQLAQIVQSLHEFAHDWSPAEISSLMDYFKSKIPELKNVLLPDVSSIVKKEISYSFESVEQEIFLSVQKCMSIIRDESDDQEASTNQYSRKDSNSFMLGRYLATLAREFTQSVSVSDRDASQSLEPSLEIPSYDKFGPIGCDGVHLSSCGHSVHQVCLDRYLSSLKERYTRRLIFQGGHIVDPEQGELLCPVCRRLANSVLPVMPKCSSGQLEQTIALPGALTASDKEIGCLKLEPAWSLLKSVAAVVSKGTYSQVLPMREHTRIGQNLEPVCKVLYGMYFPGKEDTLSKSGRVSPSLLLWDALKYTLISTEIASRSGRTSPTSKTSLGSLFKELESSGKFVLQLLQHIVQSTRSRNPLDILLRFIGLQSFESSICYGVSPEKGKLWSLLDHIDAGELFPDTQFWNQASAPVLVQDPFSTLMLLLFCLPYPILSSREYFLSLVHMFYAVSVTQALIAYFGHIQDIEKQSGFHDCLVSDIAELVELSPLVRQRFLSYYIDTDDNVKDVIHSFCLPYLRRCALLLKLLTYSGHDIIDLNSYADGRKVGYEALTESRELENMFAIPPLDDILGDDLLRSSARVWFRHVCMEFEHNRVQRALYLTPVVPFRLMRLPLIYHDLLQRFIKPHCPNCNSVQEDPALCLLCGRICTPSWKPCCRESGCQTHSVSCGAGTGVFLLIRKTTVLLQRNARQARWVSPYLDAYGEEDVEMGRGKPLYLNEERYAALTSMVASHGIDRSSKVLRQMTFGPLFLV
ncbi:hypothetical protein Drorol1_Dr00014403 [Drosera rotundifolia]